MTVTVGGPSAGFSGFGTTALDVDIVQGGDSLDLSILVYEDREVIKEDWELTVGESPVQKDDRAVPDYISTWWSENVLVVVRSRLGDIGTEALDAFLALGEPPASPTPTPTPSG